LFMINLGCLRFRYKMTFLVIGQISYFFFFFWHGLSSIILVEIHKINYLYTIIIIIKFQKTGRVEANTGPPLLWHPQSQGGVDHPILPLGDDV
jgi:hypothetical protein